MKSYTISAAFIDGLYHMDEKSMTGIIAGVCIALSCIILCIFILLTKSKTQWGFSSINTLLQNTTATLDGQYMRLMLLTCSHNLMMLSLSRKSASSKMIGQVRSDVMRSGASSANQQQAENAEVLLPMTRTHFIDAKVWVCLILYYLPMCNETTNKDQALIHI